jgi:hypothetical protein
VQVKLRANSVRDRDSGGLTPLDYARKYDPARIVAMLKKAGAMNGTSPVTPPVVRR